MITGAVTATNPATGASNATATLPTREAKIEDEAEARATAPGATDRATSGPLPTRIPVRDSAEAHREQ